MNGKHMMKAFMPRPNHTLKPTSDMMNRECAVNVGNYVEKYGGSLERKKEMFI